MTGINKKPRGEVRFVTHVRTLLLNKSAKEGRTVTFRELARALDISSGAMARWAKGDLKEVDAETLTKMMAFFGVSMAEIVDLPDASPAGRRARSAESRRT